MPSATAHDAHRADQSSSDKSRNRSSTSSEHASETSTESIIEREGAPWRALFYFTTKSNLPVLIAGLTFSIAAGAVSPAQSFIIGKVFDGFTSLAAGGLKADEFMHQEKTYVLYLLIVSAGSWILLSLEFAAWLAFGELQAKSARDRLFYGLLDKDIEWYEMRKNGIGALLPRLQAQIRELQLATSQPLGATVNMAATALLSLIQAFIRAWDLTLVTIATVPLVMVAVVWVGRGVQHNFEKNQEKLEEAQKYTTTAFGAIETVKCFNGQDIELGKYTTSISEAAGWYYRIASSNALQMALIVFLSVSMFIQGFYYGGVLIANGKKDSADVVTTFLSAIATFQAINAIFPQLLVFEKGRIAGSTLRAVMAQVQQGSKVEAHAGLEPVTCHGDIEVKNLTFAYPARPDQPVLKDVSMFLPGGDMTFLIGKSGSGKSTLGQLLMRFYSSSRNTIFLDGTTIELLDTHWIRSNITLVEQTSLLFNDTMFNNIAFGRKDYDGVTKQEVVAATEFALLQLMINDMPDGLDTVVGYKGGTMSGGQRQRMALARARLRNTPILILDESTSALDQISRGLMMDAIRRWRRGRTTIVITHDISQILADDFVYVLEHGHLVQEGYRKHMERMKGTPFQAFLPDDQKAAVSPVDVRKIAGFEAIRTRGSSLDAASRSFRDIMEDPIDAQLTAGERRNRESFLPRVFQEGSPLPGMRARPGVGAASAFSSPWTRLATSPPLASPPGPGATTWSDLWGDRSEKTPPTTREVNCASNIMEKLIEKTGNFAADLRITSKATERRPVKPIELEDRSRSDGDESHRRKSVDDEDEDYSDVVVHQSLKQIMSTLWPSIDWPIRSALIFGFYGATIHAIGTPLFSFILSKLLQLYAIPGGNKHKSLIYSMAILAISVVDASHTYIFHFFLEYTSQNWVDHCRQEAMKRILDQPREFFDKDENAVSRLTGNLDRNAEEMRNLLGRFLSLVWIVVLMSSVSLLWAMVVQWKMTLISLAAAPYILGCTKAFAAISEKWENLANTAAEDASAIFTETFTNIKTVRALTLEQNFLEKYVKATNYALRVGIRRSIFAGFFFGLADSAGNFSIAMVFYVGAVLAKSGTSVQHVVEVFTMLIMAITNVGAMLEFIPQIGSSLDTASRLLRLTQLPEDSHERYGDTRIASVGDIVFDELEFAYPSRPQQTILKHINLHISPGSCTAIVGGSGSGKSTIANLLLNLYGTAGAPGDPIERLGDLTLSGRDVKHIDTSSLRSLITPVSQTPTLFPATVTENITYGLPKDSPYHLQSAITAAAMQAGIHDFINSLPQGYDTRIGEGGLGLSGGQAQRIAIARALIRKPAVLILDEATSALDVESANLVRQTIEALVKDRTTAMTVIIITHNREMMEIAEHIVVLDQGRIVEEGAFEELLGKNGALTNLLSGGEWVGDREAVVRPRAAPVLRDVEWRKKKTK